MTTLTIPAKTLSETVSRLVSMSERANATFSRTSGLLLALNPEQTDKFAHARVSNGVVRYSEYVPCKIDGPQVTWRIPIHELARITAGMTSDEPVSLSDTAGRLHVHGAGLKARIPLITDLDFLAWEIVDPRTMEQAAELFANIHAVEWASETKPGSQSNLTAVHFSPKLVAATDRYSMAFAEVDYPEGFGGGMVPASALRSIPRLGYSPLVKFTDQSFVIQCSPYAQASVTLIAAEPLDFQSLMSKHSVPPTQARFDAKEFTTVLKRASALAEADRQLDITFDADSIMFTAGDPSATIAQFSIGAVVEGLQGEYTIRINADRLAGAMREAKDDALLGFDASKAYGAVHVRTSRCRAILMPVKR